MHILCLQDTYNMVENRKQIAVIKKPRLGCVSGQRKEAEITSGLDIWRKLHEGRGEL